MNNELKESKKNIKHSNSLALFLVGSLIMTSLWGCAAKKDNDSQDLDLRIVGIPGFRNRYVYSRCHLVYDRICCTDRSCRAYDRFRMVCDPVYNP